MRQLINNEYITVTPQAEAVSFEEARERLIEAIKTYDLSGEICQFTLYGVTGWLNVEERRTFQETINSALILGMQSFPWEGIVYETETANKMLAFLIIYAAQTTAVTNAHIEAVKALETIEAVNGYNYKVGYPDAPNFDTMQL